MEPLLFTSTLLLGREMATQTVTNTTRSILGSITHILDNSDSEFKTILNELDIYFKLEIINMYIIDLNKSDNLSETIKKCIDYISDVLKNIETEIKQIQEQLDSNKELWFSNWRCSEINNNVRKMRNHIVLLDRRFEYLTKLV